MSKYHNSIPTKDLEKWVGKPFDRIDQAAVSPKNIRVNVWVKKYENNSVIPRWFIDRSYLLYYNDGVIKDLTVRKDEK
jgi:hypothetical protein